ncbi:MAG: hypothetical protein JNL30_13200 [Rubrivivax sp.]|nr:hypothetical protein [Rubrivivax sp.]
MLPTATLRSERARRHLALAQRVADAHRGLHDATLLSFISGSTVDDLVDELSDIDMSVVFDALPPVAALRAACRAAGDGEWTWSMGDLDQGGPGVVAFRVDGIETQIGYSTTAALTDDLDDLLVRHNPDTPSHKLAEGIAKALPLAGAGRLAALQARLADFPPGLATAMVEHGLNARPTHWRAAAQIVHRDAPLWSREIVVEAAYAMLHVLCGLNRRWFTRFQLKRMQRLAEKLPLAPHDLARRLEQLLIAPPREAFEALHALEAEVLQLVETHLPGVDTAAARRRHAGYRSR